MALKGGDRHKRRLKKLSGEAVVRIAGAVAYNGADRIKAKAHNLITAHSAGGHSGGKHQHVVSKPGQPPNEEYGTLRAHIGAYRTGPLTAEVRSEAAHAAPLEWGTSRMSARPYMRPARDSEIDGIRRDFADAMTKLVKASGD